MAGKIAQIVVEAMKWPEYKSSFPGWTWLYLFKNPAPLKHQLDMMAEVPFDEGVKHRDKRLKSVRN